VAEQRLVVAVDQVAKGGAAGPGVVQGRGADPRGLKPGAWTMARTSDWRGATAAIRPRAPSRPTGADSIAAPFSISVISEMTQSCGK
jgi:hypothetical protein